MSVKKAKVEKRKEKENMRSAKNAKEEEAMIFSSFGKPISFLSFFEMANDLQWCDVQKNGKSGQKRTRLDKFVTSGAAPLCIVSGQRKTEWL